ncbi:MAG: RelA/SpoT family protein, partial [Fusobacteriaceae bacterium]
MDYWQQIEDKIKNNNLNVDLLKIKNALLLAEESHIGQYRKSGEDYILHPVEVTNILIDMKMDTDTIVAGILHDIVEDTLITLADIKYNFGDSVSELVDGVTKLKNLPNGTKNQYENIRKMILAMSKNLSVVIIKLADRLHNMRTLKYMKPEKQISIAKETLEIYAPLAHRLGLAKIKWELEDLALNYLHPVEYQELKRLIDTKKVERETYIENLVKELNKIVVEDANLDIDITGRVKHFYSIYKKMYEKGKDFDALYDLIGVRIITKNKTECYHVLGIIQDKYQPVPGRFKDYISAPKSNNYQSIHTTVIGPGGKFVEIQIRTEEMHKIAEEGIAAHWSYKEKVAVNKNDEVYGWLRGVIETQQNENSEEFVKSFTEELIKESVFVFSPKGDVVELAMGATPLDFAFNIHTDIGCKCIGSKVNGKIVPLEYKLKNGDRVDIITSKNAKG